MCSEYQSRLNQIKLTAESKAALICSLNGHQNAKCSKPMKKRWKASAITAVAAMLILTTTAVAVAFVIPVLSDYYQNSIGYQQSSVVLGESITKNGWTVTLTDSVMDRYNIYVGVEIRAPEGTVLDAESGYHFAEWDFGIPTMEIGSAGGFEKVHDEDPTDNIIQFILRSSYVMRDDQSFDGETFEVKLGGLYHNGEWSEESESFARIYDCEETWDFSATISLPEKTICIEPNMPINTLDVEAMVTQLEITPIGVYVYIEGDALKGHHSWVPKNAPDGWYGCVEYQEITLYLTDGTAIPMMEGMDGSGCSGGTDTSENGYLHLARRADTLIDMDTLDHISICGVEIPLR